MSPDDQPATDGSPPSTEKEIRPHAASSRAPGVKAEQVAPRPSVEAEKPARTFPRWPTRWQIVLAATLLVVAVPVVLTMMSVRSAYVLMEVKTSSLTFTAQYPERLPQLSAGRITVRGLCVGNRLIAEAPSVPAKTTPSVSDIAVPAGQTVQIAREGEGQTITVLRSPDRSNAADCPGEVSAVLNGSFQAKDRFGQTEPIALGSITLAPGAQVQISDAAMIGEWNSVKVAGDVSFEVVREQAAPTAPQVAVSALLSGDYVFPAYRDTPVRLFRGQQVGMAFKDGAINAIESDGKTLTVSLAGTVTRFETSGGGETRSVMPSMFDDLTRGPLPVVFAVLVGLVALIADGRAALSRSEVS